MEQFLWLLVQKILEIALPILAAALVAWISALASKAWREFKEKYHLPEYLLDEISTTAVQAAEQVFGGGRGEEKLDYAIDIAQKWLRSRGIKVDIAIIEAGIEAAVLGQHFKHTPLYLEGLSAGNGIGVG